MNRHFPQRAGEGFAKTSPASFHYNCIAWAAGETHRWWWPDASLSAYWPDSAQRTETLAAFIEAFASLGYGKCDDGEAESGVEKIAIYVRDGKPTHAARQLKDGTWTSKLGRDIDISHALRGLEGPAYGNVVAFARRPR
jgi:hypothetical protein